MNENSNVIDLSSRIANLPPDKLALLAQRLKRQETINASQARIPRVVESDHLPLSFAQQRLWFLDQLESGRSVSINPTCVRVKGPLDIAVLERTLNEIIRRHAVLRTSFPAVDGKPKQVIALPTPFKLAVEDLSSLVEKDQSLGLAMDEARRPFDLSRGPMLRVSVLRLAPEEHVILFTMHHIISDWWSMTIMIREVSQVYRAFSCGDPSPLPELPIQYADFASWQRERLQGEVLESNMAYWEKQLAGSLSLLDLPSDRPRPAVQSFRGCIESFTLPRTLRQTLISLCLQQKATLFMALLAVFNALLARYTGRKDIVIGTDIANRTHSETESLIGFFINQLVLRTDVSGDPAFIDLLDRTRDVALGAYAHQDLPFEQLVAHLQPERSLSHTPLFQVKFVLQNAPVESMELPGMALEPIDYHTGIVGFDLILTMVETNDGLRGTLEYSSDLFEAPRIRRMIGHFQSMLQHAVNHPDTRLSRLEMLTASEQRQLLVAFNDTPRPFPSKLCIHELFESQVAVAPDAMAVVHKDRRITYRELNSRANQMARYLESMGVGPQVRVGLCLERSIELLIGLLGILKAGAAYVPFNPDHPYERLLTMLRDSAVSAMLTRGALADNLPADCSPVIDLDADRDLIALHSEENLFTAVTPDSAAYVIYTSGTTGAPKGVVVEHRGVANLANWQMRAFNITRQSRISQFASYSFDAAVGESFMALLNGAALVMLDRDDLTPQKLMASINDYDISVAVLVPSIIKELDPDLLINHETAIVAVGEACPPDLALKWVRRCRFINAYGPTEYTVYSHLWRVDEELVSARGGVPIGFPIDNTKTYILDSDLNPVPIGIDGEIYISGPGVARGYLNKAELTCERFIPNGFHHHDLFIERGDLCPESACAAMLEFEKRRVTSPKTQSTPPFRWSKNIPADTVFSLVRGLDTDLIDSTQAFVKKHRPDSAGYQAFCRYLIEGFNSSYASCGVSGEILRTLLPFKDFRGRKGIDLGFGNAEILGQLSDLGADMIGLDFNPFFVKKGRDAGFDVRMVRIDLDPDRFLTESGVEAGSQDFAISTLLLDRLEEPKNSLRNLFLTLKEKGRFAIQTLLPIVGVDDAEVEDPIIYTPESNRLTAGKSVEQDKLSLITLLLEYGASDIEIYRLSYVVSSKDGIQKYSLWSFTGSKRAAAEPSFHDGHYTRMYRTGDWGRFLPDGNLEFRGRFDNQVKIRGFRIEMGEIESILLKHHQVKDCVVRAFEKQGQKRLVAYLTTAPGEDPPSINQLQTFLKQKLPEYMAPSAFVMLESFPLTAHGKIDFQKLPEPGEAEPKDQKEYVAPRNQVEAALAKAWAQVLGLKRVGVHDNIFELGGDSILIIQILSKVNQAGLSFTVNQFFKHQTIAELAPMAETARIIQADQGLIAGPLPLTPAQSWFIEQNLPASHHYNQSVLLRLKEAPTISHLEQSVRHLLVHHDALRLRFQPTAEGWRQINVDSEQNQVFSVVSLRDLPENEQRDELRKAVKRYQSCLNLSDGPLFQAVVFDYGPRRPSLLLIVIHHLLVDGVSWRILIEDLQTVYLQLQRGEPVILPPKTTSFKYWAERLTQYARSAELAKELDYWANDPVSEQSPPLPVDYIGGANTNSSVASVSFTLDHAETRRLLEDPPRLYRTQIHETLLMALVEAVGAYSGERALLIEMEGHGREDLFDDVDVSRSVGWFTSVYPLWVDLRGANGVGEALKRVKEQVRAAPARGIGYGVLRYLGEEATRKKLSARRQAEVCFNYLGQFDQVLGERPEFGAAEESSGPEQDERQPRRYLLDVSARIVGGQLQLSVNYSAEIHARSTIEGLAENYLARLRRIIAHCQSPDAGGFTVSDFPLARHVLSRLDEAGLDKLLAQRSDVEDVYPLTPLQKGILFGSLYAPNSRAYFNQMNCTVRQGVKRDAFVDAWRQVIARHSILRASFSWENLEEPLQLVHKQARLPLEERDWRGLPEIEQRRRLEDYLEEDRIRGFDLSQAPLMRLALLRLGEESYYLVWSFHHVLMDGWSVGLALKDLFTIYEALSAGKTANLDRTQPFSEYVKWLTQQDLSKAEAFWREALEGYTAAPKLANARAISELELAGLAEKYSERSLRLSAEATKGLQTLARRLRLTLNTVTLGAWGLLLSQYSGEDDIVFGSVVSGRSSTLAGVETMVGLLINTLPVRIKIDDDSRLGEWLERLQEQQAGLHQYEYSPLAEIKGWSEIGRGRPLFESILAFENYPVDELLRERNGSLEIVESHTREHADYPLTVIVAPNAELTIKASFDERRYDAASVARMLSHLGTLLERMTGGADQRLRSLSLLNDAERRQLLNVWNETESPYPADSCLSQLFERQVSRSPEAVAIICGDQQLSYRELNERANQVAHRLRELGVGAESLVGICVKRGMELVVGLLGILKAGGVYVPLDPTYPSQRLCFMLEDAGVSALLTEDEWMALFPTANAPVVRIDTDWPAIARQSRQNPLNQATPLNPAYVIYTSGSTGRPKGVVGLHQGIVNRLNWMWETYPFEDEICCQKTSIGFLDSAWEIFGPLLKGIPNVIITSNLVKDPQRLVQALSDGEITRIVLVPSLLEAILESVPDLHDKLPALKYWVTSGEALTRSVAERFRQRLPNGILLNLYGSSEISADVTCFDTRYASEEQLHPPIGEPIANTQVYLLNRRLDLAAIGVAGDLYVGGANLARGYLRNPDLTAEKFIPDPFSHAHGARLYKTGDIARWLSEGRLEYRGRIDHQVKVRGYRIELGEIEAALKKHEGVRDAIAVARSDNAGGNRLIVYYVPQSGTASSAIELRSHLRLTLPEYMIPSVFAPLDQLPLTPSGKIDRLALPKPDRARLTDGGSISPRTEAERTIAQVWGRLLGLEKIGVEENFFDLGGHSLLLIKAQSQLQEAFNCDLPLVEMFQYSTIASLARRLSGGITDPSYEDSAARGLRRSATRGRRRSHRS